MLTLLLLLACADDRPTAVVAADRSAHFLDRPFPSDELRTASGAPDLTGFPTPLTNLGASMLGGWTRQASGTSLGFSHLAPIYVRFDGPLEEGVDVEPAYDGLPDDPIRLVSLDSGHQPPIRTRFVGDPLGDPFFAPNTLIVQPEPTHPLRSGERYALVVSRDVARPPEGWEPPPEVADDRPAVATVFTVQDSLGQLRALREATDAAIDADPSLLVPDALREVASIRYAPGETPSGREATVFTVTYADGGEAVSYLAHEDEGSDFSVDLSSGPMRVFEATIHTVAFQDLADQPYASPGVAFLTDFERSDGWIHFDADGALTSEATPEPMRVVVQVPRDGSDLAVMTWDHGTGGHAYNAVHRRAEADDGDGVRATLADAGVIVVSRDQPLYGTRYPLIDEGFDASLGFYNLGNLPAFRDNQRQAAVDHRVLHRFVTEALPDLLDDGTVDPSRVGAFGHSLGSVTAHLGLAMQDGDGAGSALMSGSGGNLTYYVIETGLLGTDNDVVDMMSALLGVELPDDPTGGEAVGALMGIPEEGWDRVDGMHPVMGVFQLIMDPSDPLVLAPHQPVPETILMGVGDWQVPNLTTEWMADTLPDATLIPCEASGDYDPHQCIYREAQGLSVFGEYGGGL